MDDKNVPDFVVCICSDGVGASLEVRKIYRVLPDTEAASRSLVRIVDESGETYLYPCEFFRPIDVPVDIAQTFSGG